MSIIDRISAVMRVTQYFPPADPKDVDHVEQELGVRFPPWLRQIYAAADGFLGPTEVRYLYPLLPTNGVLDFTRFLRADWRDAVWLQRAIVFAENGLGGSLTTHWAALDGQLIEWCYGDGAEYRVLDVDIFAVWAREQLKYDAAEAELAR
jgi:hypothetical protein